MSVVESSETLSFGERAEAFYERFDEYATFFNIIEIAGALILIGIVLELAWDYKTGKRSKLSDLKEPLVNVSFLIGTRLVEATQIFAIIYAFFFLFGEFNSIFDIPETTLTWIICLLAVDFTYYWTHRIEHTVRIFWTTHSVHHSSHEYDLTTSFRVFWFLDIFLWAFFLPLILIGFSGVQVLSCMVIVFTFMTWVHTEHIGRMPYFERVFNTPSFHRVHHGMNRQYIDKNYAGMFVFWDYLLGTYEPEVEKVKYGLTKPINTSNPLKVGFNEFGELWNDLKATKSWKNRFLMCIKGPGWRPEP